MAKLLSRSSAPNNGGCNGSYSFADLLHHRVCYASVLLAFSILFCVTSATAADLRTIRKNVHPSLPSPLRLLEAGVVPVLPAYVLGVPWCFATATMLATVSLRRELTLTEAWSIAGNCIVPVLGGFVMRRLFAHHPEWSKLPLPKPWRVDFSIASQS